MLFMVLCSLTSTPLFSHHVKRYAHRVKDFVHAAELRQASVFIALCRD